MASFLSTPAVVLFQPKDPPRPTSKYDEIIEGFDQSTYGSISKDTTQQLQVNTEIATMALVQAALEAMGSISPLVAELRHLFKVDQPGNLAEIFQKKRAKPPVG